MDFFRILPDHFKNTSGILFAILDYIFLCPSSSPPQNPTLDFMSGGLVDNGPRPDPLLIVMKSPSGSSPLPPSPNEKADTKMRFHGSSHEMQVN